MKLIKEQSLPFSDLMMLALLRDDNPKTETSRMRGLGLINQCPADWKLDSNSQGDCGSFLLRNDQTGESLSLRCPYGSIGAKVWVREAWQVRDDISYYTRADQKLHRILHPELRRVWEQLDGKKPRTQWRPPMHMFRWASRVTLKITRVELRRVRSTTEATAIAEGIERVSNIGFMRACGWKDYSGKTRGFYSARESFLSLFDSVNPVKTGAPMSEIDPWVWGIGFERLPRIRLGAKVYGDASPLPDTATRVAQPGLYEGEAVRINPQGAVSVLTGAGDWLGLRPHEFQWLIKPPGYDASFVRAGDSL